MAEANVPANYLLFNSQQTKNPVIVVDIDGAPDLITNQDVSTEILFGDPFVFFGDPGLVFGGLRPYQILNPDGSIRGFKDYLDLDGSSLTIAQQLEPEQGKASVSTFTLAFIDKDGYMTKLLSPGVVLPEILGAQVDVYLGYKEISFPQDYFRVFRGYVSAIDSGSGSVTIQLSDPNIKRRQQLFYTSQTILTDDIDDVTTTIPVQSNANFHNINLDADGFIDPSYSLFIQIDDEWIEYPGFNPGLTTEFDLCVRGARGTTPAAHSAGATVSAGLQLGDSSHPENAIDMALKIMLSGNFEFGSGGCFETGVKLDSIGPQPDPTPGIVNTNMVQLTSGVDAVRDYGLSIGDYVLLSGSLIPGNNSIFILITSFSDLGTDTNRIINFTNDGTLLFLKKEQNTPATAGFRSQYNVYPDTAGLAMSPADIDIATHLYVKNTFLGQNGNDLIFFIISQEDSGKSFLESQIYFPIGAYSLTRRGLISCGYHSPPIGNQTVVRIDSSNILNPDQIRPSRSLNDRAFYNEIDITYNYDDAGDAQSITSILDSNSFVQIGIASALAIDARGVYGGYSSDLLLKRAQALLNRYRIGALQMDITVNWQAGSIVETGDIVLLDDTDGILQIPNFTTGNRGLGQQYFEVINRTFDVKGGNVKLTLVGNIGSAVSDRFAVISPTSQIVAAGSSTTALFIKDSFGAIFPGNESQKWQDSVGQTILVHSVDYSQSEEVTLLSIDNVNSYLLHITPLSFTPLDGYLIDVPNYPTSDDSTINEFYKLSFAFLDPTVAVVSAADANHFTVSSGDIGKFHVGCSVRVHSEDYSSDSGDLTVSAIVSNTIQTSGSMGFTPTSDDIVDLIGFPDFDLEQNTGQAYRLL